MSFYLDTSVILPTLVLEPSSSSVDIFMGSRSGALMVGDFTAAEVASALSRMVRIGAFTVAEGLTRLADFDAWRAAATESVDLQASDARLANIFVRRFDLKLRAPDALHAAVCRRTGHILVTLDRRLAGAATELGLGVMVPDA